METGENKINVPHVILDYVLYIKCISNLFNRGAILGDIYGYNFSSFFFKEAVIHHILFSWNKAEHWLYCFVLWMFYIQGCKYNVTLARCISFCALNRTTSPVTALKCLLFIACSATGEAFCAGMAQFNIMDGISLLVLVCVWWAELTEKCISNLISSTTVGFSGLARSPLVEFCLALCFQKHVFKSCSALNNNKV